MVNIRFICFGARKLVLKLNQEMAECENCQTKPKEMSQPNLVTWALVLLA